MIPAVLLLLALQSPTDWWQLERQTEQRDQARAQAAHQRYQAQLLRQRYKDMVDAMNKFAEVHNRSGGAVWPHREAQAFMRATERLFDCECWPERGEH